MTSRRFEPSYDHTQRGPLCCLLYLPAAVMIGVAVTLRQDLILGGILLAAGLFSLLMASAFHFLRINDAGDRLQIRFGPLPLFRRDVRYAEIESVEIGRTTVLDGWGIHRSLQGGWVWNLWGRDCVVLGLASSKLRIGTDDPRGLADFLRDKLGHAASSDGTRSR